MILRMNHSYHRLFPDNCAVVEKNGDGVEVGTCCFYSPNGICPRHGVWIDLVCNPDEEKEMLSTNYLGEKSSSLCEYGTCRKERVCFHYCQEHHSQICTREEL